MPTFSSTAEMKAYILNRSKTAVFNVLLDSSVKADSVTITEKENQSQENGDEAAEEEPEEETSELNGDE